MHFFRSLKGRFIISHLLPLLITIPLVAIALFYLLETELLLTDMSGDLESYAQFIADTAVAQNAPGIWINPEDAETFIAQFTNQGIARDILLRRADGTLLAASNNPTPLYQDLNLINQQIQEVAGGQVYILASYDLSKQGVQVFVPINVDNQIVGIIQVADSLGTISERLTLFGRYVLLVLGVQLLLGGIVGLILAIRLQRPIDRSTTAVINLAKGQYVDPPLREMGTIELKTLSLSVNDLSERLRILEGTRRRSLANLVHEIGRPLGAIKAAISALLDGADEDPALRKELLTGIAYEVERMQPHLEDLTQLHGNVTGQINLQKEEVNLNEWLPPLLLPWRAAAQEKGLQWQANLAEDLPTISIDPNKIAQALGNLLSNAVKYTPAGGELLVTAVSTHTNVQISVQDNGPGIALDEQKRIFEPFYRSTQQRRFPQGLGLGLSIARDSVAAHGGTLTYANNPTGGAIFTIELTKKETF